MNKRDDVIRGLECCSTGGLCEEKCPYDEIDMVWPGCVQALASDALSLLKEQEPKVMTLEEVLNKREFAGEPGGYIRPIWIEHDGYIEAFVMHYTQYVSEMDSVYTTGTGAYVQLSWKQSEYGKTWRCWSSLPANEQREAVKWDV